MSIMEEYEGRKPLRFHYLIASIEIRALKQGMMFERVILGWRPEPHIFTQTLSCIGAN